jgi:hypothetical protein
MNARANNVMHFRPPVWRNELADSLSRMEEIARGHGPEAILALVALMRNGNDNIKYKSAVALLDRAYGRATQRIEASTRPTRPLREMELSELVALANGGTASVVGGSSPQESEPESSGFHKPYEA